MALKQSPQYTGRSRRGTKGTVASLPHWAQVIVEVFSAVGALPRLLRRLALQVGQRWGTFISPFSM
jgi:hypothetical protein